MEVINRKENPALDRVELQFQWDHSNEATPSLSQMVERLLRPSLEQIETWLS